MNRLSSGARAALSNCQYSNACSTHVLPVPVAIFRQYFGMPALQHFFQPPRRQQIFRSEFLVKVNQRFRLQNFMRVNRVQNRLPLAVVKIHRARIQQSC